MNPSWLIFVNDTLDKISNNTISKEEGYKLIKDNKDIPEEVRERYGWKRPGRPKKG
jgi:hypothetical protein